MFSEGSKTYGFSFALEVEDHLKPILTEVRLSVLWSKDKQQPKKIISLQAMNMKYFVYVVKVRFNHLIK